MMKRTISSVLVLLLCGSLLASCATKKDTGSSDTTASTDASAADTTSVDTADKYDPKLPAKDYGGEDFTILTKAVAAFNEWGETSIYAESENGEVINDAVFSRNRAVEEKFNISLKEYQSSAVVSDVEKSVMAGDGAYDVVMPALNDAGTLASKGHLMDLNTVPYLNLTQPWWDQRSVKDLSIANKLFFVSSDISMLNNDATWCTIFNKDMVTQFDLTSPYEYVAQNNWTLDTFYTMCSNASGDLNGDSKIGPDDRLANLTQNENALAMFIGGGEHLTQKDANDIPIPSMTASDRSVQVFEMVNKIMNDTGVSLNYHNYGSLGYHLLTTKMFEEDRGLFWITNLQLVIRIRAMETPFGIVPVPKFDSTQETYDNVVWHVGSYTAVPLTTKDPERTGILLEALAAESLRTLRPAYYDVALNGKYLRDDESIDMLDIIIGNRTYELGMAFNWGGMADILMGLTTKNSTDLLSTYEKKSTSIQKAIDKTIKDFQSNT